MLEINFYLVNVTLTKHSTRLHFLWNFLILVPFAFIYTLYILNISFQKVQPFIGNKSTFVRQFESC